MSRLVAYKYRLYPNKTQEVMLSKTFGCVRFLWNQHVAAFNSYDKDANPNPVFKTTKQLRSEFEWLREVSFAALQQKERDMDAYKRQRFSKGRKKSVGNPSFKKKGIAASFRLSNKSFKIRENRIQLEKIGKVRMVMDRPIPDGKLMSATVSRNASGQYFVSITIETEIKHKPKTNKDVGIDLGIKTFSTQSDGIEIANPKFLSKSQAKLKRLQRHLSRKKKGSNRRNKCRMKIARLHQKIANQRAWFLHNYSTSLINNYDKIFIEDLNIEGMMRESKLAGAISDASWAKFVSMLKYKCDWYGKEVIRVNRFYASSKTCECGVKNDDLRLSDRVWTCGSCGAVNDRDLLAANNILKEGRRNLGDLTDAEREVTNSMKRLEIIIS